MSNNKKGICRAAVFAILVIFLLNYLSAVFFDYGETYKEVKSFYSEPENSLDVIFIGSSSCVRGISPIKIWDEYGIASYSRATTLQAPVVTYMTMKETLKYQKPKVVVLFCEWMWREYDCSDQETSLRQAIDGLKLSEEKLFLIDYVAQRDSEQTRLSYLFPFFRYHDRWDEIALGDLKNNFGPLHSYNKGHRTSNGVVEVEEGAEIDSKKVILDPSEIVEYDFVDESELYYQKTIDLCKENNIEVVLVKGYKQGGWPVKRSKELAAFAQKNEIPYLDYNYHEFANEIDIVYPDDYLDPGHLNYAGSLKMSVHIGQYLRDNYNLEDKRAVAEYQAWNEDKQEYYIQYLGVKTNTQAQAVQCELIGAEGIVGNYTYEYMLYQDGEKLLQSERMTETEYTFDSLAPGEYRVRVALYDADGNEVRQFYNEDKTIVE